MVTRRRVLLGSAGLAVLAVVPTPALALAPSAIETFISTSIQNYAARLGLTTAAETAVAEGASAAVATEAGATFLGALAVLGAPLAVGLAVGGVILLAGGLYLTLTQSGFKLGSWQQGSTQPGSVQDIINQVGANGGICYSNGNCWLYMNVPAGVNIYNAAPAGYSYNWSQTNADGSSSVMYVKTAAGATFPAPLAGPYVDYSKVATDASTSGQQAVAVDPTSALAVVQTVLGLAHQQSPAITPDPAQSPATAADLPATGLKLGDLAVPVPAAPQFAPAAGTTTGTGTQTGTSTATTTNTNTTGSIDLTAPTAQTLTDPGPLPWPSWHIMDAPPVSGTCTSPTLDVDLSAISGLGTYHLSFSGFCSAIAVATPVVRPFLIAAAGVGSIVATILDR